MKHVVITGANRGIGLAFVGHYLTTGWQVTACCRNLNDAVALQHQQSKFTALKLVELDVTIPSSIAELKRSLGSEAIDLLINNAGYYGPKGVRFGTTDINQWQAVLAVNTIAPLILTETLYPNLKIAQNCVLAFISSKVGSMQDNSSGGGYYYRSSKAALNSVVKSLSIDLIQDGIKCVVLHPGWVQTEMGGPNALIDTDTSVKGMTQVIDGLTQEQSGHFYDYQGKTIPW
ncbi:short-chain dehydrogenase/reductase SDR [Shewanella halifaxensis HAW-EB4]|uniref:Short-chain dehydrogenase/reductase SDR n=1 Tax=Shewanella halifaxensis (strain HAW-EB4) TaxID=458817 RepID=B0TTR4_SHEHH|nr:SDR family oxidoreductase [Shewanella halifaxensis]ABZ76632.1 short-chain dehydrogenase/reductase SDR [Shewanella halifaxensis HAW-EB4]